MVRMTLAKQKVHDLHNTGSSDTSMLAAFHMPYICILGEA